MNLIPIRIDGRESTVEPEVTIWEAARRLSITIPALCHQPPYEPVTSCMICMVEDTASRRLLPSCSMPVSEGMQIETDTPAVREARKAALELLLSEHLGDCRAPCQRGCPAHMNIPLMNRQIARNRPADAIRTIRQEIALPAVLGRICPAPCEKVCHRRSADGAVSICQLKRFAADADLALSSPFRPECRPPSGKRVAVIGAGPTGLSAAYYLLQEGHACHLFDAHPLPGGMLRYAVPRERLDVSVLDAEIQGILELGAVFHPERTLGNNLSLKELQDFPFDAVVLAMGGVDPSLLAGLGLETNGRRLTVHRQTFRTSLPGVYAGGNLIGESRMAIRASAHGKAIALAIHKSWDSSSGGMESPHRFHSVIGKLSGEEVAEYLQEASGEAPLVPEQGFQGAYPADRAAREAARCFQCDCRKLESCLLRRYAEEYGAEPRHFKYGRRKKLRLLLEHPAIVHEPGKCIRCGLCIRISRAQEEEVGLTFIRRGFDLQVSVPFGDSLQKALTGSALACAQACPTAALALRERPEK